MNWTSDFSRAEVQLFCLLPPSAQHSRAPFETEGYRIHDGGGHIREGSQRAEACADSLHR